MQRAKLFLCVLVLQAGGISSAAAQADEAKAVLKFVKTDSRETIPAVTFVETSCAACRLLRDPAFDRDNQRETLVGLTVPTRRTLELKFYARPGGVKRVLLDSGDLQFTSQGDILTVRIPPVTREAVTAGEVATHIVEPGMVLRFEHADPVRRAGAYASGPFPSLQRRAADNLEFAQREVIRRTGLGTYVAQEKLGTIQVMGFDTNYPHGHIDSPPHMHMHMRWPGNAGTQIGHYYIDEDGLLDHNKVSVKDVAPESRTFRRGEVFATRDLRGRIVYIHEITSEGWLRLGRADKPACLIRPATKGFDTGAVVECPNLPSLQVNVIDDLESGVLRVTTGKVEEVFRYDKDSGKLLSDAISPPATESNYVPFD